MLEDALDAVIRLDVKRKNFSIYLII